VSAGAVAAEATRELLEAAPRRRDRLGRFAVEFGGKTFTRKSEADYTHAAYKRGRVSFHTSKQAAQRTGGTVKPVEREGGSTGSGGSSSGGREQFGVEVGGQMYWGDSPPKAVAAARAAGAKWEGALKIHKRRRPVQEGKMTDPIGEQGEGEMRQSPFTVGKCKTKGCKVKARSEAGRRSATCPEHGPFPLENVWGVKVNDVKCGGSCRNAVGPSCDCSCGGANHGKGHVGDATRAVVEALALLEALPPRDPVAAAQARVRGVKPQLKQRGRTGTSAFSEGKVKRVAAGRTGGGQFATKGEQEKLASQKLYDGKLDGIHGPKTDAAVKAFQRKHGLPESGKMDERTRATLAAPPPLARGEVKHSESSQDKMRANREERAADAAKDAADADGKSAKDGDRDGRGGRTSRSSSRREEPEDQSAERQGALAGGEPLRHGLGMDGKLKRGDKRVRVLQQWLLSQGYDLGGAGVDGRFGDQTKAAVRRLQRDLGLRVDGIVGNKTRRVINLIRTQQRKAKPGLTLDTEKLSEAAVAASTAVVLEGDAEDPSQAEREEFYAAHGRDSGVSLKRDRQGWFVHTHRARSRSFKAPKAIPKSVVAFIESTG
jgi:peptidoglycan hydrolase-like protein with peptidoglycan-binding domain